MKKFAFITFVILSLISCDKNFEKLEGGRGEKFENFEINEVLKIKLYYCRWCLPVSGFVICNEVMDSSEKEYKFIVFNQNGKIVKERVVSSGNGPGEISATQYDTIWVSENGREILCIDANGYLKAINTGNLRITTISKLSNAIKNYGSRYTFQGISRTSIENKNNEVITAFESTGFWENNKYYFVRWKDNFENFRIIGEAKKEKPEFVQFFLSQLHRGKDYIDYYNSLRLARIFSVDWERGIIYHIPQIEKPEIESIDFKGKRKKYKININFKRFKVDKNEFEFYCDWVNSERHPIFKNLKAICYIPPYPPPLQGIKVIGDYLILITGKRDWENGKNEALVYRLPYLKYEGSFYIPFPNFLRTKWVGEYFITYNLIKEGSDYYSLHTIYRIKVR